jgi:hypothetical protein
MPLDFPSNPVDGQVYEDYYYDATVGVWNSLGNSDIPNILSNGVFTASSGTAVPLTVNGASGQSANLQEWKSNAESTLASISANGGLSLNTPLSVQNGGTGATDASSARTNLNVQPTENPTFTGTSSFEWVNASQRVIGTTPNDSGSTGGLSVKAPAGGSQTSAYLQFVNNGYTSQYGAISASPTGNMTISSTQLSLPSQTYFPGSIVQVQHAQTPGTRYVISSANISAIPNLTISFTPKFANSRILLQAMINSSATYVASYGFLKNGGYLSGVTNTNSQGSVATTYYGGGVIESNSYNNFISYSEFPGTTSTITYAAAACSSWSGTNYNLHINDRSDDTMRGVSSFTIFEIAQ